jgi:hypothetical protein
MIARFKRKGTVCPLLARHRLPIGSTADSGVSIFQLNTEHRKDHCESCPIFVKALRSPQFALEEIGDTHSVGRMNSLAPAFKAAIRAGAVKANFVSTVALDEKEPGSALG